MLFSLARVLEPAFSIIVVPVSSQKYSGPLDFVRLLSVIIVMPGFTKSTNSLTILPACSRLSFQYSGQFPHVPQVLQVPQLSRGTPGTASSPALLLVPPAFPQVPQVPPFFPALPLVPPGLTWVVASIAKYYMVLSVCMVV